MNSTMSDLRKQARQAMRGIHGINLRAVVLLHPFYGALLQPLQGAFLYPLEVAFLHPLQGIFLHHLQSAFPHSLQDAFLHPLQGTSLHPFQGAFQHLFQHASHAEPAAPLNHPLKQNFSSHLIPLRVEILL